MIGRDKEVQFSNSSIKCEPRVLVESFEISEDTLRMIDSSMDNLKKEKVSNPIDLSGFARINMIDQAIEDAEIEVAEGAKPISAKMARKNLDEKYYG